MLNPTNEQEKIALLTCAPLHLPSHIVQIITAYKGLEEDKMIRTGSFWRPITTQEVSDFLIPSLTNKDSKGTTALDYAQKYSDSKLDVHKKKQFQLCINLLEHQTKALHKQLIRNTYSHANKGPER